jgi:hypothetical protein
MPVLPSRLAAARREAERAEAVDQNLLEEAQVGVQVLVRGERDDRVADELARAVVGDVAAAVGLHDFDALAGELGGIPYEILLGAIAEPEREDRFVLREHEGVTDLAADAPGHEFILCPPRRLVARAAPVKGRGCKEERDGRHAGTV